ncbi:MAG: pantetheine-phosphate adenylyltransferase [Gemmatimonadota bacterium]
MRSAIYAGTFDPLTLGHLDLVRRARSLVDELTISVAKESGKDTLFSLEERMDLIRQAVAGMPGVHVAGFRGLLVRHAAEVGATAIVRGLRAVSDFEYEFQMALMNRQLAPGIEILFMVPGEAFTFLSSSLVREVAMLGGDVSAFVPPHVAGALETKFAPRKR